MLPAKVTRWNARRRIAQALLCFLLGAWAWRDVAAQSYDRVLRGRVRSMFDQIAKEVSDKYYDPAFGGVDIEAHFRRASEALDQAATYSQALTVIAQALTDLNDSHLYFDPPSRTSAVDYGWRQRIVGDTCLVTAVRPESDAAAKALKPGDTLLSIEGYTPTRGNLWKLDYIFYILNRFASIRVVAKSPGGEPRALDIEARVRPFARKLDLTTPEGISDVLAELDNGPVRHRFREKGGIVIWQMAAFDLAPADIDDTVRRNVAGANGLVLDLRGNGGGYVDTLQRLVSHFFNRDVHIADLKGREKMPPLTAKKRRGKAFGGKVVVIVDSQSASAAEVFARVMQLEKRAVVIGDRTEGAVMQAQSFLGKVSAGPDSVIVFGASITTADVILSDGRSLEHVGVTPDELLLPTPADLAAGHDRVLMRAVELAGGHLSLEASGRLFPFEWRK
jgi:carboxyl-terminal processing protease